MPGSTPKLTLPYPVAADPADVPHDIKALADRLDLVIPVTGAAWIAPTLLHGWDNATASTPAGYLKDPLGFVHCRGRVAHGANGTIVFVFPAGFRPANNADTWPLATASGASPSGQAICAVDASGNMSIYYTADTAGDIALTSISFLAEH